MKKEESLFILLTKGKRKTVFLRQCDDGTYYFSKSKKNGPRKWILKYVYLEDEEVTLQFVESKNGEKKNITVISNPRFEKIMFLIEPSKFAPFQHEPKVYNTVKRIEQMEQDEKIRSQEINIISMLAIIIVLLVIIFKVFVF